MADILDISYPFDAGPGSTVGEQEWRTMARLWLTSGVVESALQQLEVYVDGTANRTVRVRSGQVWIDGFFGEASTAKAVELGANASGNPRIDTMVARLDLTNDRIEIDAVAGTPAASPVRPTLTTDATIWEIPLADVRVASGATVIGSGDLTDRRVFAGARYGNDPNARPGSLPWGQVDEITLSSVTVGAAVATVLSLPFTAVAGRRYRAHFAGTFRSSGVTAMETWWLLDGSPIGNLGLAGAAVDLTLNGSSPSFTASAGTRTVTVQHRWVSGGGAGDLYTGGSGGPMVLWVEDVGPA